MLVAGVYLRRLLVRGEFSGLEDVVRACAHRHVTVRFRRVFVSIAPFAILSPGSGLAGVTSRDEEVRGIDRGDSDGENERSGHTGAVSWA
jgi:hypothetical protein